MQHALPLLIRQATEARDREAARLRQAQQSLEQAQATLQRLQAFRAECLARAPAATGIRSDGARLADDQRFMTRLDEAIAMQTHEVALREGQAQQQRQRLLQGQQRLLAFETLARRQEQQRQGRELRREQLAADEFAARATARAQEDPR